MSFGAENPSEIFLICRFQLFMIRCEVAFFSASREFEMRHFPGEGPRGRVKLANRRAVLGCPGQVGSRVRPTTRTGESHQIRRR